jgi:hypothetical protein
LPFLRFTRDKRGYETTSLVHAGRRGGRSRPRILYWFRTPPGVKVGRPALDEEAIRWIEEHNPDIEFDWPKILEAQPPAAPPVAKTSSRNDDGKNRRPRRDRERARPPQGQRPAPPPAPESAEPEPMDRSEPEPFEPEPSEMERLEPGLLESEPLELESLEREPLEAEPLESEPLEPEPLAPDELAHAFEQLTHPETDETPELSAMPVEQTLGREQLTRLRARYAELQARITERGGDPARVDALRAQSEALNPDTWVTDEEVRQGIESFEPKIRDLRAALGLRRRRRSRRGGRRRRSEGPAAAPAPESEPDGGEG